MIGAPKLYLSDYGDRALQEKLKELRQTGQGGVSPEKLKKLKKVSREFEALFLERIWREMKKTISPDGLFHDPIAEKYMGLFDWQFALTLSRDGGIGLGDFLYNHLKEQLEEQSNKTVVSSSLPPTQKKKGTEEVKKERFNGQWEEVEHLAREIEKGAEKKLNLKGKWPIPGDRDITSPYGWRRDPFLGEIRWHNGIDIGAPTGTPIRAISPGKVIFSGYSKGYGNLVILQHKGGWESYYAHNEKNLVKVGEEVRAGEIIARVGSTGRATGPHLHLEVRHDGTPIDPLRVFPHLMAHRRVKGEAS